jgi:hypothetical protein
MMVSTSKKNAILRKAVVICFAMTERVGMLLPVTESSGQVKLNTGSRPKITPEQPIEGL